MPPTHDPLQSLLTAVADDAPPAPEFAATARRIRVRRARNRAVSVAGGAAVVAALSLALPSMLGGSTGVEQADSALEMNAQHSSEANGTELQHEGTEFRQFQGWAEGPDACQLPALEPPAAELPTLGSPALQSESVRVTQLSRAASDHAGLDAGLDAVADPPEHLNITLQLKDGAAPVQLESLAVWLYSANTASEAAVTSWVGILPETQTLSHLEPQQLVLAAAGLCLLGVDTTAAPLTVPLPPGQYQLILQAVVLPESAEPQPATVLFAQGEFFLD